MKPPDEWTAEDLQLLVDTAAEEGPDLEFKSAGALKNEDREKNEISKDVSSFANSAGGIIIYGIKEAVGHAQELTPIDTRKFSKEWLEQVINSRIHPRIERLSIFPVYTSPTEGYYIVSIPQSFTAHQASDKKYYKRFNFESAAMEDYEVRQTMNRRQRPTYRPALLKNIKQEGSQSFMTIKAFVENTSEIIGEKVSILLLAPEELINAAHRRIAHGPQMFGGVPYLALPGDGLLTLAPFTKRSIAFTNFPIRLPVDEAQYFDLIVRIYDEHGFAGESTFKVASASGKIVSGNAVAKDF